METPHPWQADEAATRQRMSESLKQHLDLAADFELLAFHLLSGIKQVQADPGVLQVHTTLLARVLQDLRVVTLIAPLGYTMQAWTIAASAFEAAYAMGFIGADSARARRWLDHSDMKTPPWSTYDAVENSLRYLDLAEDSEERRALAQKEYELYKFLCMAKHVNPIPERTRYWFRRGNSTQLRLTPIHTPGRASEARLALSLALRSAINAVWVFHKTHVTEDQNLGERLLQLATRSAELLSEWNGETLAEDPGA